MKISKNKRRCVLSFHGNSFEVVSILWFELFVLVFKHFSINSETTFMTVTKLLWYTHHGQISNYTNLNKYFLFIFSVRDYLKSAYGSQ